MNAKWFHRAVWAAFFGVMSIGCNPISTLGFIFRDEQKVKATIPLKPHLDAKGEVLEDVKVVLLCTIPGGGSLDFAGADRELISLVSQRFPMMLAANGVKDNIKVVPTVQVDKFKASHPQWKALNPSVMGRQMGVDYVIDITIGGLQIYEPGSNKQIYQGKAEVNVDVYDCTKKSGEPLNHVFQISYPHGMGMGRDASAVSVARFKQELMYEIADKIILHHIDHKPSYGIASGESR
jgi:hypothetical protein